MELKTDKIIRVCGKEQYAMMKKQLDSSNETYTVMDMYDKPDNEDFYFIIFDNKKEKQDMEYVNDWMDDCIEILKSIKLLEVYWNSVNNFKDDLNNKFNHSIAYMSSETIKRADILGALEYLKTAEEIRMNKSSLFEKPHECQCKKKSSEPCNDGSMYVKSIFDPDLYSVLNRLLKGE